jgi:hypothetical protein
MALTMRKMPASRVPGTEAGRTGDVWAIFDGSKPFKTKQGGQKWFTQEAKARAFIAKESGKAAPKKSSGSRAQAKTSAPKSAPKAGSAQMTVTSCSKFLRDAGYSVSKKKGAKKGKSSQMSEEEQMAEYYASLGANPRRRRLNRRRRKNPNRSAYVVTFRIGGGRDEYQETIMASSQSEAIRLAEDRMDEIGDGVLVSVVPQAMADTDIIFGFDNPRRKRRRKNPRTMRRLR